MNGLEVPSASEAVRRIAASIFSTQEERGEARGLAEQIAQDGQAPWTATEPGERLRGILTTVLARERGRPALSEHDKDAIEEGLGVLEDRLAAEIERRKVAQRRDLLFILGLLAVSTCTLVFTTVHLILRPPQQLDAGVVVIMAQLIELAAVLFLARLFQNGREALERLDEKVVAVRFLRMALHPSWVNASYDNVLQAALQMFGQHFAPTSETLSAKETTALFSRVRI